MSIIQSENNADYKEIDHPLRIFTHKTRPFKRISVNGLSPCTWWSSPPNLITGYALADLETRNTYYLVTIADVIHNSW